MSACDPKRTSANSVADRPSINCRLWLGFWGEAVKRREFAILVGSAAVAQLVRPPIARAQDAARTYRLVAVGP